MNVQEETFPPEEEPKPEPEPKEVSDAVPSNEDVAYYNSGAPEPRASTEAETTTSLLLGVREKIDLVNGNLVRIEGLLQKLVDRGEATEKAAAEYDAVGYEETRPKRAAARAKKKPKKKTRR